MLTSITGVWLFAFHAGSFRRRTGWTIVTGLILFCMLWISGGKTSQTVLKVKKDAAQMTEQLRYGEDNMPSGSLAQAASLEQGDEPRLRVKTEQIKPLYLKVLLVLFMRMTAGNLWQKQLMAETDGDFYNG